MTILVKENIEKPLKIFLISIIVCCCVLLLPQTRDFIIKTGEKLLGINITYDRMMKKLFIISLYAAFLHIFILIFMMKQMQIFMEKQIFLERHGENIFYICSIVIIAVSVIVRIIMYVKCRSFWGDEAALARSIVTRNWFELLTPPLFGNQSAPILYVIVVKVIGSIFGYSEISLRIFSFFAFIGLLFCEIKLLKNAFNFNNYRTSLVVVMCALLPSYIWYSNEFKPYMGDAFFVILTILLYFYYIKDKIKLPILSFIYILILGFSTPSVFFIGGILFLEFVISIFNKNKKQLFSVSISSIFILVVFCLYFHWWMAPLVEYMETWWAHSNIFMTIKDIIFIFSPGIGNSDSSLVMFFVPFALLGIFSLIKLKNKIACSVALSVFFVFLASAMGKWPMTGRLWLFLPAIVLIFTPLGIDFIHDKIRRRKTTEKMELCIFSAIIIYLFAGCLGYIGDKMYYNALEINPLVYYVQRNIKEGEKLYIYPEAVGPFAYKNGYAAKIGNASKDNIIYGKDMNEWAEGILGDDLQLILENKKTYLIFDFSWVPNYERGLEILRNYGTLTEVMNVYNTPLYYFETTLEPTPLY